MATFHSVANRFFSLAATLVMFISVQSVALAENSSVETGHFHHVTLNVEDVEKSQTFYQKVFGASPITFNQKIPALFTERSFILLNKVNKPAYSNLKTTIWHLGWAGVDGPNEYEWWKSQGIEFYQPVTALGRNHYMYLYGADKEIVEIYTGDKHHRFNHVHLLATDVKKTSDWLMNMLALPAKNNIDIRSGNIVVIDNVQIIVFANERSKPKEQGDKLLPTEGSVIRHIAFSFRDLASAYQRMKDNGANIEQPIQTSKQHGLPSFFVRGPDNLLVEFVKSKPIPQGIWE